MRSKSHNHIYMDKACTNPINQERKIRTLAAFISDKTQINKCVLFAEGNENILAPSIDLK